MNSPLIELQTFRPATLLKRDSNTDVFLRNLRNFYLKPVLSLGLPFLIIYGFVSQLSLHYYWYCYSQKQSSGGALRKRCSNKFRKFHKKTPALKTRFQWSCRSAEFNFIKEEIQAQMFFVNSGKFLLKPFLKNPSDGCFCINPRSVYFPSTTLYLLKNDVTYFPAEYFLGLICRLGTRVSSIFQTLS